MKIAADHTDCSKDYESLENISMLLTFAMQIKPSLHTYISVYESYLTYISSVSDSMF